VFIGTGLTFAEGINFDRDGTLYCVDVFGGGIWRMPPGGELREWVNTGTHTPDGTIVTSLPAGGIGPTNVAFWQESLYVTEGNSGSIYHLDIGVPEQPPFARPW
jgi:sugar lactone lactonase YvrE